MSTLPTSIYSAGPGRLAGPRCGRRARQGHATAAQQSLAVAAAVFLLGSAACAHNVHPAHVEPGWRVGLAAAQAVEDTRAGTDTVTDMQLSVGHGWRFDRDRAFGLTVIAPLVYADNARSDLLGNLLGSAVDAYYQFFGGGVDFGAGVVVSAAPELYVKAGHVGQVGVYRAGATLGSGVGLTPGPFVTFDLLLHADTPGRWHLGLWARRAIYYDEFQRCDESCHDADFLSARYVGGLLVGRGF